MQGETGDSHDSEIGERLVIPSLLVTQLRNAVLRDDGHEWFSFVFCGRSGNRFLATDLRPVAEEDHKTKARGGCRVEPEVELSLLDECVGGAARIPLLVHSHPFHSGGGVDFSSLDAEMMEAMTQWLENAYPDQGTGPLFAVVGQDSMKIGRYDTEGESDIRRENIEELPVEVLGEWALDRPLEHTAPSNSATEDTDLLRTRHDRTIRALTEEGQARLSEARVGIVSAGGIGSLLVEQLARLGVGELVVVDPDVVEASNLNRLYGATHDDVGEAKVDVLRKHVTAIDPDLDIEVHTCPAQEAPDRLRTCDLLVAGVDRISARMWLNQFAVRHLIPYVDAGTIIRTDDSGSGVSAMEGIVQTIIPGVTGCFSCLDRGDPEQARIERLDDAELEAEVEDGYVDESFLTPEPAVVHLNSLVASKAVDVVVRLLTGFDEPSGLVRYEGLDNTFRGFRTTPSDGCTVCGEGQLLGRGEVARSSDELGDAVSEPHDVDLDPGLADAAAADDAEPLADFDIDETDDSDDELTGSTTEQSAPEYGSSSPTNGNDDSSSINRVLLGLRRFFSPPVVPKRGGNSDGGPRKTQNASSPSEPDDPEEAN